MRINFLAFQNTLQGETSIITDAVDMQKGKMDKKKSILNIITGIVIVVWAIFNIIYYCFACSYPFKNYEQWYDKIA